MNDNGKKQVTMKPGPDGKVELPKMGQNDDRVIFAVLDSIDRSKPKSIVVGMSRASFEKVKDGTTHTIAIDHDGLRVNLMIFGGETTDDIRATIGQAIEVTGADVTHHDGPDLKTGL